MSINPVKPWIEMEGVSLHPELREHCLYLHFDGARYCFKRSSKRLSITYLIYPA